MLQRSVLVCAQIAALVVGCSQTVGSDDAASSGEALNAESDAVWPTSYGVAEVRVCWLPPNIAPGYFPIAALAPDIDAILAERKWWVRTIVEEQWNARTPMHFSGWQDCDATSAAQGFVQIEPMNSSRAACPGLANGQSCTDALGKFVAGKTMHLNVFFGDEFLYNSIYLATLAPGEAPDTSKVISSWWLPAACLDELKQPWWSGSKDAGYRRNIFDGDNFENAYAIFENCLQANTAHEFGHAAGFAHEQYRSDNPTLQAACFAYEKQRGFTDDISTVPPELRGDKPLGTFDTESIMSYCRQNKSPALTNEDVFMTRQLYK